MSTSLEKALVILECISEKPQSLGELSESLGVHKSTVLRLLRTLEAHKMVRRDHEHRYRHSSAFYAFAHKALADLDLRGIAAPYLRDLNSRSGMTLHLGVLQHDQVIYIDKYEGATQRVQMYSRVGVPAPLQSAAIAKAILAHIPEPVLERMLATIEFVGTTDTSIRSLVDYRAALQQTRDRGYAVDHGELEPFIHCIGMPLFTLEFDVAGGLSMVATTSTHSFEQMLAWVPELGQAAHNISRVMGADIK